MNDPRALFESPLLRIWGVALLVLSAVFWLQSGSQKEKPVFAADRIDAVAGLERAYAKDPKNEANQRALVEAYLDASQPGLAESVLARSLMKQVATRHLMVRVLLFQGHASAALAESKKVLEVCSVPVTAGAVFEACSEELLVAAQKRHKLLQEMVDRGVEDVYATPETAALFLEKASVRVRVTQPAANP
jgi:hypothetical protein